MKRFLLSIFCLIFINNLSANEGLTGFCFEEAVSLATIKGYLQPILLAKDKIYPRDSVNCVEINLSASRKNLFETYLARRYKIVRVYSEAESSDSESVSAAPVGRNCSLTLTKQEWQDSTTDSAFLGNKNGLKREQKKHQSSSKSQLLIGLGMSGSISMDEQEVFLGCLGDVGGSYNVKVSIVSPKSGIATQVYIRKGSSTDIGSVVDDLNDKVRTLSVDKGLEYSKTSGKKSGRFFLGGN